MDLNCLGEDMSGILTREKLYRAIRAIQEQYEREYQVIQHENTGTRKKNTRIRVQNHTTRAQEPSFWSRFVHHKHYY